MSLGVSGENLKPGGLVLSESMALWRTYIRMSFLNCWGCGGGGDGEAGVEQHQAGVMEMRLM